MYEVLYLVNVLLINLHLVTTNDVVEMMIRFWFLAKDFRSFRAKAGRRGLGARLLVVARHM